MIPAYADDLLVKLKLRFPWPMNGFKENCKWFFIMILEVMMVGDEDDFQKGISNLTDSTSQGFGLFSNRGATLPTHNRNTEGSRVVS